MGKDLVPECSEAPFCVYPMTVSEPANTKERLILDLGHVNFFLLKRKVKFEGTKEGLYLIKKELHDKIWFNNWLISYNYPWK